ncbi:hypothetical protein [Succinimonas amylolytica]|uniref:hypothetical protein n=1 Tax=Succinimonas amylolytica TaxID=83769 RepID=UPI000374021A|nr:hypothetical protein [Succinimonas amylolytica]
MNPKPKLYVDGRAKPDAGGAGYVVEAHSPEGTVYIVHYGKLPEYLDASNTPEDARTPRQIEILKGVSNDEPAVFIEEKATGNLFGPEDYRMMEGVIVRNVDDFDPFIEGESDWFKRQDIHNVDQYIQYMEDHSENTQRLSLTEAAINFIEDQIRQAYSQQGSSEWDFTCDVSMDDDAEDGQKTSDSNEPEDDTPKEPEPQFVFGFDDDDEEIQRLRAAMRQKRTERETVGEDPNFKYHENDLPKLPPMDI